MCLAGKTVNGSGNGARSGAQALMLLATPPVASILSALEGGPTSQAGLHREIGLFAQTTLRTQLKRLGQSGLIARRRHNRFPNALEYELEPAGQALLPVADRLERWLTQAPKAPLLLGDNTARAAVNALVEAWSTTMLRALASGPLSLTSLDQVVTCLSYPSLERRLAALRLTGQVEKAGDGRGTPYAVTTWARQGVGPLLTAAQWERRYGGSTVPPLGRVELESVFLLAAPLPALPAHLSGSCRLAVELSYRKRGLAGIVLSIDAGRVHSYRAGVDEQADAWALGSASAWLEALVNADTAAVETGGDGQLAHALLESLHEALFSTARIRHS